jgi:uncharacterized protein (DUF169 family)
MDFEGQQSRFVDLLGLRTAPVAVAFRDEPPAGMAQVPAPQPAGCGYWRLAAEGGVFATSGSDHHGCPVGAHTHGVPLPPEKRTELEGLIGTMVGLEYLTMDEVPSIPHRTAPFGTALYAPLAKATFSPDVVLVRGNPRQLMLLAEAAQSAGIVGAHPALGRPTCAVIPQALSTGRTAVSLGCVGNRVYTGAADDEAYFAVPGDGVLALLQRLEVLARANRELEAFHRGRSQAGSSPE